VAHGPADAVRDVLRWADAEVEPVDGRTCRARIGAETLESLASVVAVVAVSFDVDVSEPPELMARLATVVARLDRGQAR
jgi:hypothetical protein